MKHRKLRNFIDNNRGSGSSIQYPAIAVVGILLTAFVATSISNSNETFSSKQGLYDAAAQADNIADSLINSEGGSKSVNGADWSNDPLDCIDPGLQYDPETGITGQGDSGGNPVNVTQEESVKYDDLNVSSLEYQVIWSSGETGGSKIETGGSGGELIDDGSGTEDEKTEDPPETGLSPGDIIEVTATVEDIHIDSSDNNGFYYKFILFPYYDTDIFGEISGLGTDGEKDYELIIAEGPHDPVSKGIPVTILSGEFELPDSDPCYVKFIITEIYDVKDFDWSNNNKEIEFDLDISTNHAPDIIRVEGSSYPRINEETHYIVQVFEPDGDDVYLNINWGDGQTETIGPLKTLNEMIDDMLDSYEGDSGSSGGDIGEVGGSIGGAAGSSGSIGGSDPKFDQDSLAVQYLLNEYGSYVFGTISHTWDSFGDKTIIFEAEDTQGLTDTELYPIYISLHVSIFSMYKFNPETGQSSCPALCYYCFCRDSDGDGWTTNTWPTYDFHWYDCLRNQQTSSSPYREDDDWDHASKTGCGKSVRTWYHDESGIKRGPLSCNHATLVPLYTAIADVSNLDINGLLDGTNSNSEGAEGSHEGSFDGSNLMGFDGNGEGEFNQTNLNGENDLDQIIE